MGQGNGLLITVVCHKIFKFGANKPTTAWLFDLENATMPDEMEANLQIQ